MILYLALLNLFQILNVNAQQCVDDVDYRYGTVTQTCSWIRDDENRRQDLCMNKRVALNCPFSCGYCCENDLKYSLNVKSGSSKKCSWLANNQYRKDKWCGEFRNGQLVQDGCSEACGVCLQKVTTMTSRTLSSNGRTSDYAVVCENDTSYIFNVATGAPKRCRWLFNNAERQKRWCGEFSNGKLVEDACPKMCDNCIKTPQPTSISTDPPTPNVPECVNNANFKYKTHNCEWIRDNKDRRRELCLEENVLKNCPISCGYCCADDPDFRFNVSMGGDKKCSWLSKKERKTKWCPYAKVGCPKVCNNCLPKVTGIPTAIPATSSPTSSYKPTPKGDCVNNFGYIYDADKTHTCNWIRDKEDRRQELCLEAVVPFKCPISCGNCCDNDKNYRFKITTGGEKTCSWMIDNEDRIKKWCGEFNNGQLVKDGCPKVCNNCLPKVNGMPTAIPVTSAPTLSSPTRTSPSSMPPISADPSSNPSSVPSSVPSSLPSVFCFDSTYKFKTKNLNDNKVKKDCTWVRKEGKRCKLENVKSHCPVTCKTCDDPCNDSTAEFWLKNKYNTCATIEIKENCKKVDFSHTCRASCDTCPPLVRITSSLEIPTSTNSSYILNI